MKGDGYRCKGKDYCNDGFRKDRFDKDCGCD
jgi:hypothetical protein